MRSSLKRIRGAIGMGVTWAVAWSAVGVVPRWILGINADAPFPLVFGVFGFICGVVFAIALMVAERRRPVDQLSMSRFVAWGAAGGFVVAAVFARAASFGLSDVLLMVPTFATACAVSAAGSLALARRASRKELSATRDDAAQLQGDSGERNKLIADGE